MHKKDLGTIGENIVILECLKHGLNVFTPVGDNTKADLIVLHNNIFHRIQVKCFSRELKSQNSTAVRFTKSGPNYRYTYSITDVDFFAVVDICTHKTAWIEYKKFYPRKRITLNHAEKSAAGYRFDDFCIFPFAPAD